MDNVEYKSCIVPQCKNNTKIAPNLTYFEVPTKTHIIDKWREAIGVSMDLNTVMYCCQDHFDLQDDTDNYTSDDANGGNKIQLHLKYDAVPHRFECQSHMGHPIKPVSMECNEIEGSSSDIDPLTCSISTTPPPEEINHGDVNISNKSTKVSDVEEVLKPTKDANEVKEPEMLTSNAIEGSSSDIDPLTCSSPTTPPLEEINHGDVNISNNSTKVSDVEEVLKPMKDANEVKVPEILTTNAIKGNSSEIEPLMCSSPTTPPLEEINHSDINNYRKDSNVEEVLKPIEDKNEMKEPEILTTNAIEGSSSVINPLTCSIPTTPPQEEVNHSDISNSTKYSNVEKVLKPIEDKNEMKEPEILAPNAIEGSSSEIEPLMCSSPTTPPLEEINHGDVNISNNSTKVSDVEEVLKPIKDANEVKEPEILTTNAIEDSSSDIDPLTCSIPTTPPQEEINHSDINNSTKDLDEEEVLEPIKDMNEVKEPEMLTTNVIEGSSSDIDPLTCSISTTPPSEEISDSHANISNNSTKVSDVEEVLKPLKDANEVKEPEILTTNAIEGSSSVIDPLTCSIPTTPPQEEINHSDINNSRKEVLKPIKDANEVKEPEILTTNAIEGSSSDIDPLTCSIPTTPPQEEINHSDINNSTKDLDEEEVLEPIKDMNEVKEPEMLTTNVIEGSSSDIDPLTCSISTTPPSEEISDSHANISNNSVKDSDIKVVLEPIKDTNEVKEPKTLTTNSIEGSSPDVDPLTCSIPTTPPLEEINHSDINHSTKDSNVEEVLMPIEDTNEMKEPEMLTTNAIEGSSSDIHLFTCSNPTTPPLEEIKHSDENISNNSAKDSDVDVVLESIEYTNEGKEQEMLTTNAIEGSSSDIDPLTCSISTTPPSQKISDSDVNISNNSVKDSDVKVVLEPIKDTNEVKEPKMLTTNAIEGSSATIDPLTCSIPTTPPLEEISHGDKNNSTKDLNVEEVLKPIKDTNEVKEPKMLTTNAIEGSSSDIDPLRCSITTTPPSEEISNSDVNISNNSTKDSDVKVVLEPIKDTNEVKEPKILTTNAIEGSCSDIDPLACSIPTTPPLEEISDSDVNISNNSAKDSDVEVVLEPIKDTNKVIEPKMLTTNAIEGSSSNIDPLTCFISTTPHLEEINHDDVNISNNSTKVSDVKEVLEPIKDSNEVKEPEMLTTNAIEGSSSNIDPLMCSIPTTPPLEEISDSDVTTIDSDVEFVSESIEDTNANSKIRIIENKIVKKNRLLNIYRKKRLMALCKPSQVQLEDLKNILAPKIGYLEKTDVLQPLDNPEHPMALKRKQDENSEIVLKKRSRLISKIITWDREQSYCIAIHDLQCKEIDIYYLNSDLDLTTYKRIIDVSGLSENEQSPFTAEFKGRDDRLTVKQCCCWFNRENVIGESLAKYFRKSNEFIKKKHPCKGSICTCCCRNIPIIDSCIKLPDMGKTLSVWLKNIKTNYKSPRLERVLASSAVAKAMIVKPKVQIHNIVKIINDNESLNVKINNDYYQIADGHLVLYSKYEDGFFLPLVINKNVCCWYARENVLNFFLKQKVSLSAVKFMKTPHLCPITACKCCCKPKQKIKTHLPHVYAITSHTTDTRWKNRKIKIVFSNEVMSNIVTPPTKTKVSQNSPSKTGIRILDTKIIRNKTPTSVVPGSNTRPLQNETSKSKIPKSKNVPLSKPITLQNNTSSTHIPVLQPVILQNNTNDTNVFDLNTLISRTIQQSFRELDPTNSQESMLQPFGVSENPVVEMDNTPNNNLTQTSLLSLVGLVPNDNTMTDRIVPDNPDITNNLLSTYIKPKSTQRCRAKNPLHCKCKSKSSINPTCSVSDLKEKPISVHSENEESNVTIQFVQTAPTVGSIISMADLCNISIPVLSDDSQDSNKPSICTFIQIPNTDADPVLVTADISADTNNFITDASCAPVSLPASSLEASKKSSESGASTSHMPVTKAIKNFDKKTLKDFMPTKPSDTLKSSTIGILQKLSDINFIYNNYKLSAQLKTELKNLSTTELRILNSAFVMVEEQIKAAGLEKEKIHFDLSTLFDNIKLPENEPPKFESRLSYSKNIGLKEMYTRLGSLTSLRQKRDTSSFNALVDKQSKKKPTKRSVKFCLESTKIHNYDAESSFKKVKRK